MSFDMSDAFDPDAMTAIDITRHSAGSYVDGVWVDGAISTVNVQVLIQQPIPDDLLVLPEGLRSQEAVKIHSLSELRGVSEENETLPDTFTYRGKPWRVYSVTDQAVGNYYKAIAIRDNA